MTWIEVAKSIARRWVVFMLAFLTMMGVSLLIRGVGSEFIASATLVSVVPAGAHSSLDVDIATFESPIALGAFRLGSSEHRNEVASVGLSDNYTIDYVTEFPVVQIVVRAPTHDVAVRTARKLAADLPLFVDQGQAEQGADPVSRTTVRLVAIDEPWPRPASSPRALVALAFTSFMIAAGTAYAADQYGAGFTRSVRLLMGRPVPSLEGS